jgi:hypothetical protein
MASSIKELCQKNGSRTSISALSFSLEWKGDLLVITANIKADGRITSTVLDFQIYNYSRHMLTL